MELSFCELKCKEVINICDGKNMGTITDIIFDTCCGRLIGIVVPCNRNFFNIFKSNNDLFIPYNRICKIGKDIILVDIIMQENCIENNYNNYSKQELPPQHININSILKKNNTEEK